MSGVRRTATLHSLPSPALVEAALRAVPEIRTVEYRSFPREITMADAVYDQFGYSGAEARGTLLIRETSKGEKTLCLYYYRIGAPLPREIIDRVRRLMDKVYASLRAHIPEVPPESELHEELFRVQRE